MITTLGRRKTNCYDADFLPYGDGKPGDEHCPQNYKWTGKERDAETGNDDFDARYYSSTYGRFPVGRLVSKCLSRSPTRTSQTRRR